VNSKACWNWTNIITGDFYIKGVCSLADNSTQQNSSSEANSCLAGWESLRASWHPNIYCRVRNNRPLRPPILSLISILTLSSHLFKGLPKWPLSFRIPHQNSVHISIPCNACYMRRSSHLPWWEYNSPVRNYRQILISIRVPKCVKLSNSNAFAPLQKGLPI
jgi:hypothetical protein